MLPSYHDTAYEKAEKVYATDRFLVRYLLRWLPAGVTPNQLTVARIVLVPFVIAFLWQENYWVGIPLFLFAALTDALDGAMARTRNMITAWGRIFDPFADKLLVLSVAGILAYAHLPLWLLGAVVVSELLFIVAALLWHRQGRLVQANIWGKVKMILQVTSLVLLLLSASLGLPLDMFAAYTLGVSLVFSLVSFLRYGG